MVEWGRLVGLLSEIKKGLFVIAPVLVMMGLLCAAIRWHHLLAGLEIRQRVRRLYGYYIIGLFFGIFLPTAIGGDVFRIGVCARETKSSIATITTSVLIERIFGMTTLLVIGSVVMSTLPLELISTLGKPAVHGLLIVTGLSVAFLIVPIVISRRCQEKWSGEEKNSGFVTKFKQVFNMVIRLPYYTFLSLVLFSLLFQAARIVACFALAKSLNISVPLSLFFVIMPLVYVLTLLPVSLGGLGVREGALVYFLGKLGVSPVDAVALSFLIYFNGLIIASFGGITYAFWKGSVAENLSTGITKTT
jgi:hypothetical protein